jgi:uncharacterized protein YecE (DUF72 family)
MIRSAAFTPYPRPKQETLVGELLFPLGVDKEFAMNFTRCPAVQNAHEDYAQPGRPDRLSLPGVPSSGSAEDRRRQVGEQPFGPAIPVRVIQTPAANAPDPMAVCVRATGVPLIMASCAANLYIGVGRRYQKTCKVISDVPCHDNANMLRIGTAGWNVPAALSGRFPAAGSHLERYATRLNCVEINSSFYRPHQKTTYARWANSTPATFRFAVKLPKSISHAAALQFVPEDLERFMSEVDGLGAKLGVILVQFPPCLAFDQVAAGVLFDALRHHTKQGIACEPRHASWFTPEVDNWMIERRIARVAADPSRTPGAGDPGGWRELCYMRLHGSPHIYYSSYDEQVLDSLAAKLEIIAGTASVWCIFDNTAAGAAMGNAICIAGRISSD